MGGNEWTKPGPGTWLRDSSHCGPAPGPMLRELFHHALPAGMEEGLAHFGAPLKTMDMEWVNGKFYRRLVPLIGGGRDLPPPPAIVLKVASRFHPAFRRAEARAKESFETKRWRSEMDLWENDWKPSIIKKNLGFADVDVPSLSDTELADQVTALWEHLLFTTALHFRLHVSDMGPLGNLMVHLEDWGLAHADTFRALIAASPATRAPAAQLASLADSLRAAGVDPDTLTSLDDVRAASSECASLLDEYLRHHGWRLTTGYDLEDRVLVEVPNALLAAIQAAARRSDKPERDSEAAIAALRDEVPAEHRAEFDDLVEDARLSYGLRDENGPVTYEWPAGLLRRVLLEADRRLVAIGCLTKAGQVFELRASELAGLLRGATAPSTSEIEARAAERARWAAMEAPEQLGPDEAPPPVDALPPNLAKITRIVLAVVATLEAAKDRSSLTGLGIGDAPYVGRARVVHDAAEAFASVEPGDVIVAPYTAPTYNAVLSLAGAVITEQGGLLSHAAVLARELGIPAVIGAKDAMSAIPDGATVEVDPSVGAVRVLS